MCIVHSHTMSPEEPMTPMEIFTRQIFIRQIMAEVQKNINEGRLTPEGNSWADYKIVPKENGLGFRMTKINE